MLIPSGHSIDSEKHYVLRLLCPSSSFLLESSQQTQQVFSTSFVQPIKFFLISIIVTQVKDNDDVV